MKKLSLLLLLLLLLAAWFAALSGAASAPPAGRPAVIAKPPAGDIFRGPRGPDPAAPGPRPPPSGFARESDLIQALHQELAKSDPSVEEVENRFEELQNISRFDSFYQLSALLATNKGENKRVPLTPDMPNLLVQRPAGKAYDKISNYLTTRVLDVLNGLVNRDTVILLPFVFSADAKAKLAFEIPLIRQAPGGLIDNLISGDFNTLATLKGKTVVVVGHVAANNGVPAFEIRRDTERRYVPIGTLLSAARNTGFNLVLLGCETAEAIALGTATKINDLDALDAFKRAMATSGFTSYGKLLADLSSPKLQIMIDLAKLGDGSIIPIDLVDEDNKIYRGYPGGSASNASAGELLYINTSVEQTVVGDASIPTVSSALLARSQWFYQKVPRMVEIWTYGFLGLVGSGFIVALVELTLLRFFSVGERMLTAVLFFFATAIITMGVFALFSYWPDQYIPVIFGTVASWGFVATVDKEFPDYWWVGKMTRLAVAWAQLPLLSKIMISVALWTHILVPIRA
jgi:hypothetical protein